MENKNIIIILIVIIVVLAAAIGVTLLNPTNAKEPTRLIITNDDEQNEGGELSIKLTDLNKTPISKEIVNIRITDGNGNVVVDDVVKTNSKGKANLDLDLDEGEYIVNVSYGGNDNFTASNATQKLTIKEEVEAEVTSSSSSSSTQSQTYASGLTDEEIDAYIQRDLDERAKNGVQGSYNYQDARSFYENVPPTGMG